MRIHINIAYIIYGIGLDQPGCTSATFKIKDHQVFIKRMVKTKLRIQRYILYISYIRAELCVYIYIRIHIIIVYSTSTTFSGSTVSARPAFLTPP